MKLTPISATAVEKLNKAAKVQTKGSYLSLAEALDHQAKLAGFDNWKHVTLCANLPPKTRMLPPRHSHSITLVMGSPFKKTPDNTPYIRSIAALRDALGFEPVLIRSSCDLPYSTPGGCLCQIDPFATAHRGNVFVDIGDKYDSHNYLFMLDRPYQGYPGWKMRVTLRLATSSEYPNEDLLQSRPGDDRSNSQNPNNPAFKASQDNRSNQLNPNNPQCGGPIDV